MNANDTRPTRKPRPTAKSAAPQPLHGLRRLYRDYRPECWVTLALVAAAALTAATHRRPEGRRVEPALPACGSRAPCPAVEPAHGDGQLRPPSRAHGPDRP
jgi:hypothetical protein